MARKPATISQLNDYLAKTIKLDPILGNIYCVGQISDLKYHSSGHIYFSAMDDQSKIRCMIPYSYAQYLEFKLEEGQEVLLTGYIDIYKKGGSYSLIVKDVEVKGLGKASLEFQMLVEKLKKEGLFNKHRPIPQFPKRVGIITSETGAALQDILKIIKSRNNYVDIYIFPCKVQGEGASQDMAEKVRYVNDNFIDIDTLIIGRGGGSAEDLIPFNDEGLARAIFASKIPVISAVGHEIDFTISDFVADLRAETPTAAAQIAVPDIGKIREEMENLRESLRYSIEKKVEYNSLLINNYCQQLHFTLSNLIDQMKVKLDESNPFEILDKGYAVMRDLDGKTVTSVEDAKLGESYQIILKDGDVKVKVIE
ncbi:MAG: exodeoxyribonuclease VII large subunit [Clostridia bacterium]|nr:exodeoxyribonuclease VII large subunit [Clostridia bacterium]